MLAVRWRRVRVMVRQAVVEQNILGLGRGAVSSMTRSASVSGVPVVQMFQRWIDNVLQSMVLENDDTLARSYIQGGYDAGARHGRSELEQSVALDRSVDRVGTLSALAFTELQGIVEAVSQQAVRVVASSILTSASASKVAKKIQAVIDSVGVTRSTAMVELLIVKAFAEGTLDVYEAAGVTQVGLLPESVPARRKRATGDSAIEDARKTGPGSRSSRRRTPSSRTIGRIEGLEKSLGRLNRVNVETAEDDRVCPVCEDISENGPYTINRARALIPAHPRCRCVFVPVRRNR